MKTAFRSALALVALLPLGAHALHRQTPPIQMLSSKTVSPTPPIAGVGASTTPFVQGGVATWVAFQSRADLKNLGGSFAGGQQVFLYENDPRAGRNLYQITNKAGVSENPSVDNSGKVVAFDSDARLLNVGPVGVKQIYTFNRTSQQFSQWTYGNLDSTNPVIHQKGRSMIFLSKADLKGNGSAGKHVFLWRESAVPACIVNLGCGQVVQITPPGNYTSENATFSPDDGGQLVLFNSNTPVDAVPAAGNHQQIVMFDRGLSHLFRLTNYPGGDSTKPTMDVSQRWLAFQSNADPLNNGSGGWEIFLLDRENNVLRQVTNSPTGDSTEPSIGFNGAWIAFVSTSDVLGNGSSQQNLFLYDVRTQNTYQMTHDSSDPAHPVVTHHPLATGFTLFFFDTTADLLNVGNGYPQVYSLNIFNWLPNANLGPHQFEISAGTDVGGSKARVVVNGTATVHNLEEGQMSLAFGARSVDGDAAINVQSESIHFPPIPMPDFGALCMTPTGNGSGFIDCDGGHENINVSVFQDHNTDDSDLFCQLGCREGESCQGPLPGAYFRPCDYCKKLCQGGTLAGLPCETTEECQAGIDPGVCVGECSVDSLVAGTTCTNAPQICNPVEACEDGLRGICRGPEVTTLEGDFGVGAAKLTIPVSVSLSNGAGLDGAYCTEDDGFNHTALGLQAVLRLTTGASTRTVRDFDNLPGQSLTDTQVGLPFSCDQLLLDNMNGATFVGGLHFLNVPDAPGFHDVVVGLSFTSGACTTNCPTPCTADSDCSDGNPCSGAETCGLDGYCKAGIPLECGGQNSCSGNQWLPSACNPSTGACEALPAVNCDDSNVCTTDTCNGPLGCVNAEINCQDGDQCNGTETCDSVLGCQSGVPPVCDDGNPCNGAETCSGQYGCLSGTAIVCSNGDACDGVESCNPLDGSCSPGTPLSCGDGNPCNGAEVCDTVAGCLPGAPIDCSNGDQCDGAETCDPTNGACLPGVPLVCDDTNSCTTDSCSAAVGCVNDVVSGFPGIKCVLNELNAELATLPPGTSMTPKLQTKLRKIVGRVLAKVQSAERSSPTYRIRHARHSTRLMKSFVRLLQAGEAVGKCNGPGCSAIRLMASNASIAIQPLLVR